MVALHHFLALVGVIGNCTRRTLLARDCLLVACGCFNCHSLTTCVVDYLCGRGRACGCRRKLIHRCAGKLLHNEDRFSIASGRAENLLDESLSVVSLLWARIFGVQVLWVYEHGDWVQG